MAKQEGFYFWDNLPKTKLKNSNKVFVELIEQCRGEDKKKRERAYDDLTIALAMYINQAFPTANEDVKQHVMRRALRLSRDFNLANASFFRIHLDRMIDTVKRQVAIQDAHMQKRVSGKMLRESVQMIDTDHISDKALAEQIMRIFTSVLSEKEQKIAKMYIQGKSSMVIAEELGCSGTSITEYLPRIFTKLGTAIADIGGQNPLKDETSLASRVYAFKKSKMQLDEMAKELNVSQIWAGVLCSWVNELERKLMCEKFKEGMAFKEIAKEFDCSDARVRSLIYRRMNKILDAYDGDAEDAELILSKIENGTKLKQTVELSKNGIASKTPTNNSDEKMAEPAKLLESAKRVKVRGK